LKLHPGIVYSHAASQICPPPVLIGYSVDADIRAVTDTGNPTNTDINKNMDTDINMNKNVPVEMDTDMNMDKNRNMDKNSTCSVTHVEYLIAGI
jgi:hypothetical protein